MTNVKFPEMRSEVVSAVRALADPEYQRRVWIERQMPPGYYDDFALNIHILYDDTRVLEDPYGCIGVTLQSSREAEALKELALVLDAMFERLGTELPDADYIRLPEWGQVVDSARHALGVLTEGVSVDTSSS